MPVILAALSALFYGCGDFAGGLATRKGRVLSVMAVSQIAGLAFAILCLPFLSPDWPGARAIAFGALGGVSGAFGLFMLYRGLGRTVVAIVSPSSALLAAAIPLAAGAVLGERPAGIALAGAAICLPAIILLSMEKGPGGDAKTSRSALLHGIGAGLGFGFFFILISKAGDGSGLWPLIAARFSSIGIFLLVAAARKESLRPVNGSRRLVVAAGVLDMAANIAFLLSSRLGFLMIASAVTSLYPAPTVILARVFMGQKLGPARVAGLALAIAGTALIAMGQG
jgi:drug/metabolite transporter (DMT)-like permease